MKHTPVRFRLIAAAALAAMACSPGASDEGRPAAETEPVDQDATNRVTLSEAAYQTAAIVVEPVRPEPRGDAEGEITVPGQVAFDPTRVALVSPRTAGRVEHVAVVEGDRVQAGAAVAWLLSPAFLTAQTEFVRAVRRAQLLQATPDAQGAQALADAARRRLRLLGVTDTAIARLAAGGEPADLLALTAPFSGSIVEVPGVAGASVEAGAPIARIADLSVVLVEVDVPERALAVVRPGQRATVRLVALPGTALAARLERIRDELDPATRTAKALIRVRNPGRALKAGMFATVTLAVSPNPPSGEASGPRLLLSVPASAVVTEAEAHYVFIEVAPRTYERRAVSLEPTVSAGLPQASERVVIRDGLAVGERVVTHGAFTLKSELAKASFGEEHE